MNRYHMDPNDFVNVSDSDSRMIQKAVDEAHRTGCNSVIIPSLNQRTGAYLWVIEESILLPSHMTVLIDNAHLVMADGVFCQMFRNANALEEIGRTADGLQEDIVIQGVGRSVLDGGRHNGLREGNSLKDGMPSIFNNLTIYLHNVRNFKIDNLTIRDQRWWGMAFAFAWEGVVSNLRFELTDKSVRGSVTHPWRNQDGVDLRVGCHDIQIMNLTGETGDDIVALTALAIRKPAFEVVWSCDHLTHDIYNVTIKNITGRCNHCALIRLLCHNGRRIYNVNIDGVTDTTPADDDLIRTASCVKVGENNYCKDTSLLCKPGEMRDIFISNVHSSALAGVVFNCTAENVIVRNLNVTDHGTHAVSVSQIVAGRHMVKEEAETTDLRNVLVDGVVWNSARRGAAPFYFDALIAENVRIRNVVWHGEGQLTEIRHPVETSGEVVFENVIKR